MNTDFRDILNPVTISVTDMVMGWVNPWVGLGWVRKVVDWVGF